MRQWCVLISCLLVQSVSILSGIELKPWFDPIYEPQTRITTLVQFYHYIDVKQGLKARPAGNFILDLELYGSWRQYFSMEVEALLAATRDRTFGPNSISLTGRYLWWDDVLGDPVSLVTGATIYKVFKPARHDLSLFHHGGIEIELHTTIGKEVSCHENWQSRAWLVGGLGAGDSGSPWIRLDGYWEHRFCKRAFWRFSLLSLWGLGKKSLKCLEHFHGYGPIQHHSIDLGLRYTYVFDHNIMLSAEYGYRIYAHYCPRYVNFIFFVLDYPI